MKALLLKDLFVSRRYLKTLTILLVCYMVFAVVIKSPTLVTGFCVLLALMFLLTSFAYDEQAKWEIYALSTPVSKNKVVLSKYILFVLCDFAGCVPALIVLAVFSLFGLTGVDADTFLSIPACFFAALGVGFLLIPIILKYGTEKCRLIMIILFVIPIGGLFLLENMGVSAWSGSEDFIKTLIYLSPLLIFVEGILSYFISIHIYKRKDL